MSRVIRNWWPIFSALLLIQLGNGLSGSLVSVTAEARHFAPHLQGLVLSSFFAGSIGGALAAPWFIKRTSHQFSAVTFTLALAATVLGFAFFQDPWAWVVIRLLAGAAITGMFTTVESWLNLNVSDNIRARVFSVYLLIQLAGLASGQILLAARSVGEVPLFVFSAFVIALSVFSFRSRRVEHPVIEATHHIKLTDLSTRATLGIVCIGLSGVSWAGLIASGPATLELMGLSDIDKSLFMAIAVMSGMAAQLPTGWLADHMDRRIVMLILACTAFASACLPLFGTSIPFLFAFACLFGAATFPLYGVGVALVSDSLGQSERTSASAWMIIVFDIGAVLAPMVIAPASAQFGTAGYFTVQALPHAFFVLLVVAFLVRRPATPA